MTGGELRTRRGLALYLQGLPGRSRRRGHHDLGVPLQRAIVGLQLQGVGAGRGETHLRGGRLRLLEQRRTAGRRLQRAPLQRQRAVRQRIVADPADQAHHAARRTAVFLPGLDLRRLVAVRHRHGGAAGIGLELLDAGAQRAGMRDLQTPALRAQRRETDAIAVALRDRCIAHLARHGLPHAGVEVLQHVQPRRRVAGARARRKAVLFARRRGTAIEVHAHIVQGLRALQIQLQPVAGGRRTDGPPERFVGGAAVHRGRGRKPVGRIA
ncbi:hypothetical protein NB705_002757 [Xanthomonas sacchari]|nr:hypothetical protein [Xanthomonas sacchari]